MSSTCFEPSIHLQADGCTCSYGIVRFTCIGISSLVGRGMCSILYCIYKCLPEDEPTGTKHVEAFKIKNYNINIENVHLVDLCCVNGYCLQTN